MKTWALVLGGGDTLWDDVVGLERDVLGMPWPGLTVVVNDIGCIWPRTIDHWCSLHYTKMPGWQEQRVTQGLPGGYVSWVRKGPCADRWVRDNSEGPPGWGGSSGLLAVQIALTQLHCTRIVLCGVPMTPTPHVSESDEQHLLDRDGNWVHADKHWKRWVAMEGRLRGVVRSMSGRTRELFGEPDARWLRGR